MNWDTRKNQDLEYNNIKYYMDRRSMTVRKLCERTGIPEGTIYNYMQGVNIPNVIDAVAIADALYCSVYDLFFEEPSLLTLRF